MIGVITISKQLVCQKYIYKIHSSRLRKSKWNLSLPISEARSNDEVISLADSQMLRWIDELNGISDADSKAKEIKSEIRELRSAENTINNKRAIRKLYEELDALQFKPDYMCLIIDKEKDYLRACKGFKINGIKYRRLLGTNGGIKNSTIVFVSDNLADELIRRVENGRDPSKELVTAKLEAYKALTCSASIPVSYPNGILIVNDAETEFLSDIMYLTDEGDGEPLMEERKQQTIQMDASDGFGLMLPSLARRWSEELGLDYVVSGVNTRFSFEKGMLFTFDFIDFAQKVANTYLVTDAWGNEVDIRNVEAILTTSMVKLFDSYSSCDEYLGTSIANGYTFGIAKTCPFTLESERSLNYQFIQSYDLDDEDIDELIAPTVQTFHDILGGDISKTILYLKGVGLTEKTVSSLDDDYIKAIMIDRRMAQDPYIQNNIYQMMRNRINEAKVGVIPIHGNYSIASGDPFLLCQSIFGLQKTGLLQAGEIYNKYWSDCGAAKVVCFRAPMSCHPNIIALHPAYSDEIGYWYRYMNTCTIFNSWDTSTAALNGMDYDGDLVMLTDNPVLIRKHKPMPALMCVQRRAQKRIPTEDDFIQSNIESFGNEIGQTTNWITSMYDVRSGYSSDSEEYKTLTYRIMCGQLYQQNVIDKAKGIIAKPMPKDWHDRHEVNKIENIDKRNFYRSIVADKKPYFMRYIYPALSQKYNTYLKNTDKNALREFQLTVSELKNIPEDEMTDRQREFLRYYDYRIPVGTGDCVMNRICRRFEMEFDGYIRKHSGAIPFDYSIMKSGAEYSSRQFYEIKRLYDDYNKRLSDYMLLTSYESTDESDNAAAIHDMNQAFRKECDCLCPNSSVLCDILLDICYLRSATKRFVWNMCGSEIIRNLLLNNDMVINYPVRDDDGSILYGGNKFSMKEMRIDK